MNLHLALLGQRKTLCTADDEANRGFRDSNDVSVALTCTSNYILNFQDNQTHLAILCIL